VRELFFAEESWSSANSDATYDRMAEELARRFTAVAPAMRMVCDPIVEDGDRNLGQCSTGQEGG
jgi:hypothetical protein